MQKQKVNVLLAGFPFPPLQDGHIALSFW